MQTLRKIPNRPFCLYLTKENFLLIGRRFNTKGSEFPVDDLKYANDTAVLFDSEPDVEICSPLIIIYFFKFEIEIHVGDLLALMKPSKIELLFVSKPPKSYLF